jgi:hypothetical protein
MDVAPSHPLSQTPKRPDITVVLDVEGSFAPAALREMEQEANRIIGTSGIRLDWRTRDEALAGTFNDLVVMTFKGACALDPGPQRAGSQHYSESAPYAFTRTVDGEIQPFGEVDCDHVAGSVREALPAENFTHSDLVVGRALGRVVAHELVHMLTRSGEHGREGVEKAALSARQLIGASLPLSAPDVDRLKQRRESDPNPDTGTRAESETR